MLNKVIQLYEQELTILEESTKASEEQILRILTQRDRIHKLLPDTSQTSEDILLKLFLLDNRLKKQANKINQEIHLADWRASLEIPGTFWWWFLQDENHRLDQFDWLWNALTVTSLTASVSLLVDISTRFLSGGTGLISSFAVISQSVLTLITAGSILTEAGRIGVEKLLLSVGIKTYLWQETKLGISALLLFSLISVKVSLPKIAEQYNQQALTDYEAQNWDNAISNYQKSINLDADNAKAHRQLGLIYEQLQDLDKAQSEYRLAAQGNLLIAYSDLARLYLIKKKPAEAVSLLYVVQAQAKSDQKLTIEDNFLLYNLHKNLGWARFQQQRYPEAQEELEKAITFQEKLPLVNNYKKNGAAYCLLAQVFENLKSLDKANTQWELCIAYGNNRIPEVDTWKGIARQRLKPGAR